MNYKQLKTPNLDPVIYQGGSVLYNWLGYCLAYAQTAFGAPWAGSTAWEAWTSHVTHKHNDKMVPKGVYSLLWFSHLGTYGGVYKNWGHVAIMAPDGRIWSSPLSNKSTADVFGSIEEIERKFSCTFQGWSEDIGGLRVIEPTNQGDAIMDRNMIITCYQVLFGRTPAEWEINSWMNMGIWTLIQAGATEANQRRKASETTIAELRATIDTLDDRPTKAQLDEAMSKVKASMEAQAFAEAKLAEELAKPPEVVAQTITHNVPAPLTWKTVKPWLIQKAGERIAILRNLIRRK